MIPSYFDGNASCAFCSDGTKKASIKIVDGMIGNYPLILGDKKRNTEFVCPLHWEENKSIYEQFEKKGIKSLKRMRNKQYRVSNKSKSEMLYLLKELKKSKEAAMPPEVSSLNKNVNQTVEKVPMIPFDALSPLFIQFLAWQRLMQINEKLENNRVLDEFTEEENTVFKNLLKTSNFKQIPNPTPYISTETRLRKDIPYYYSKEKSSVTEDNTFKSFPINENL